MKIGRIFGIPIIAGPSFIVPFAIAGFLGRNDLAWSLCVIGLVFTSVILHELGHCLALKRCGKSPESIRLMFCGAAAVSDLSVVPQEEIFIALAGPFVSLLLCYLFSVLFCIWPEGLVGERLNFLSMVNASICIFNMVPIFPLDGGRIVRSFFFLVLGRPKIATEFAVGVSLVNLIILGIVFVGIGQYYGLLVLLVILLMMKEEGGNDRDKFAKIESLGDFGKNLNVLLSAGDVCREYFVAGEPENFKKDISPLLLEIRNDSCRTDSGPVDEKLVEAAFTASLALIPMWRTGIGQPSLSRALISMHLAVLDYKSSSPPRGVVGEIMENRLKFQDKKTQIIKAKMALKK